MTETEKTLFDFFEGFPIHTDAMLDQWVHSMNREINALRSEGISLQR
jgi:hypothetical protein